MLQSPARLAFMILKRLDLMEQRIMTALSDLQAAETAQETTIATMATNVQAVLAENEKLITELGNTSPDDTDALHVLTAKILANNNAIANLVPTTPNTSTASAVAAGQVVPPAQGGVTTDQVTGGLVADTSIPSGADVPSSIPATPGKAEDPQGPGHFEDGNNTDIGKSGPSE